VPISNKERPHYEKMLARVLASQRSKSSV
jgi:hypothetical protein